MARHLTEQVRSFAEVTSAIARGDLNQKIEIEVMGEMAELKETVNGESACLSSPPLKLTFPWR